MFSFEIVGYNGAVALPSPEEATDVVHHFLAGMRSFFTHRVCLGILIRDFVRIKFRAVRRQENPADIPSIVTQPFGHRGRTMHRMPVNDQIDLAPGLFDQTPEKAQAYPRGKSFLEHLFCHSSVPPNNPSACPFRHPTGSSHLRDAPCAVWRDRSLPTTSAPLLDFARTTTGLVFGA